MNKFIVIICFHVPLVISCLNIQGLLSQFISSSLSQFVAYLNLGLIIIGVLLFRKNIETLSSTNRLWYVFYLLYYSFGLLASGVFGFQSSIVATLVPVIYFTGFNILLSNRDEFKNFFKLITICFVISAFVTILFIKLNFNIYTGEVLQGWNLDRAGGLTGDPNAAAYTSVFAFILFNQLYQPFELIFRVLKVLVLTILFYSLFLTFSTTGLFVFTIVFFLINSRFFTGLKLVLFVVMLPLFYMGVFYLQSQIHNLDLSKAQTNKVENITNLLTLNFEKVDNSGRSELLVNVMQYLYKNPILGNGIDFAVAMRGHNTYIGIWVDAGVISFLFFIFMLFYYFFKSLSLKIPFRFFATSILTVLCVFMVSLQSVINQPNLIVLFVFVGYIIDYNKSNGNLIMMRDSEVKYDIK